VKKALSILGIAGSLRRDSLNRRLVDAAAALAPDDVTIARYDALGAVPMFDEDVEAAGEPAGVRALRDAVAAADGLLIATPEYNQSFPAVLKNAIDWLSRGDEVLAGKPVALVGATAGRWGTRLAQAGLRQVLAATESPVMPSPMLFLAGGEALFDAQGRLRGDEHARLADLVAAFAAWTRRYQPIVLPLPPKSVGASA
jgi:chromate reductase